MAPSSEGKGKRGSKFDGWGGHHSNQQGIRGVWVYSGATGQCGDSAESLVGRHEHANMPGLL